MFIGGSVQFRTEAIYEEDVDEDLSTCIKIKKVRLVGGMYGEDEREEITQAHALWKIRRRQKRKMN